MKLLNENTSQGHGAVRAARRRVVMLLCVGIAIAPGLGIASSASAAKAANISPGPTPTPAPTAKVSDCVSGSVEWCQKLVEHFCHRLDCAKLADEFRGTATGLYRQKLALEKSRDAAFEPPWNGDDFDVHHIVAQVGGRGGLADFAQALLQRVGIRADDIDNLAALRGVQRQKGKPGYEALVEYERSHPGAPKLSQRMAHVDTLPNYYYQSVNETFADWIHEHGGKLPDAAQVRQILRDIKADLYAGGVKYIWPGRHPRVTPATTG